MNKADLIQHSGLHRIFRPFYGGIGHVLVLHRVCNDNNYIINKYLQISKGYLENIIKFFISNKIDIITLDECYNRITTKITPKRFVVFTFDDGYADNLTEALPVFEKYNVPFGLFLATCYPDHDIILWWYLLEDLLMRVDKIQFEDGDNIYQFNTLTINEKINAFWSIRRYIMDSNKENLLSRLQGIFGDGNVDLYRLTKRLAISWEQVQKLSDHPLVTIGTHTTNHLSLSSLTNEKVIEEITNSMDSIHLHTRKPVNFLAYPFGSARAAGEREFTLAQNCGIKMAFTARNGNILKRYSNHLMSLPRIGIDGTSKISNIDLYINGLTPILDSLFAAKQKWKIQ